MGETGTPEKVDENWPPGYQDMFPDSQPPWNPSDNVETQDVEPEGASSPAISISSTPEKADLKRDLSKEFEVMPPYASAQTPVARARGPG